jgi:hypothetical protein
MAKKNRSFQGIICLGLIACILLVSSVMGAAEKRPGAIPSTARHQQPQKKVGNAHLTHWPRLSSLCNPLISPDTSGMRVLFSWSFFVPQRR